MIEESSHISEAKSLAEMDGIDREGLRAIFYRGHPKSLLACAWQKSE